MFIHFHLKVSEELWSIRENHIKNVCETNPLIMKKSRQQAEDRPEHSRAQSTNIYNTKLMSNIVHIKSLNLNWCLVPKAASTSISSVLLPYLPNMNLPEGRPHIQQELWERAGHLQLSEYLSKSKTPSFLVTRHPFARVASAYRNKMENRTLYHDGEYFYQTYSKKIIRFVMFIISSFFYFFFKVL